MARQVNEETHLRRRGEVAASVLRNARSIGSRPDLSTRIDHEEVSARRRRWIGQVDIEVAAEPGIRSAASLSLSLSARSSGLASPGHSCL